MAGDRDLVGQLGDRARDLRRAGPRSAGTSARCRAGTSRSAPDRRSGCAGPRAVALDLQVVGQPLELRHRLHRLAQVARDLLEPLLLARRRGGLARCRPQRARRLDDEVDRAARAGRSTTAARPPSARISAPSAGTGPPRSMVRPRHQVAGELEARVAVDLDHAGHDHLTLEAEGVAHRAGDDLELLVVRHRERDHQHEEADQKTHQIGEGDHPERRAGRRGAVGHAPPLRPGRPAPTGSRGRLALVLGQIRAQELDHHVGIGPVLDVQRALDHQRPVHVGGLRLGGELVGDRQGDQVRDHRAVERGQQRDRHGRADGLRVVHVAQHLHQADQRPDHAEGRRGLADRAKDLLALLMALDIQIAIPGQRGLDELDGHAIDAQLDAFLQELVADLDPVEPDQALLARLLREPGDLVDQHARGVLALGQGRRDAGPQRDRDIGQRESEHGHGGRAANHQQQARDVDERHEVAADEDRHQDDRGPATQADQGREVHGTRHSDSHEAHVTGRSAARRWRRAVGAACQG